MKKNYKQLIIIAENLGNLYEDGIPIIKAIELLEELTLNVKYKNSIKDIKNRVTLGETLSNSFSEHEKLYPKFFIGILKIGESSGKLTMSLKSIKKYYYQLNKAKKELTKILIYPSFLIVVGVISICLLFLLFIPKLYEIISSINGIIPKRIEAIHQVTNYLYSKPILNLSYLIFWIMIPIGFFVAWLAKKQIMYRILSKTKIGKEQNEYILILILSVVLSSGVSIGKGLSMCVDSSYIDVQKNELDRIYKDVMIGRELSFALRKNANISKYSLSMVKLGEDSGTLIDALQKLEIRLEEIKKEKFEVLFALLQPIMIVSMAACVMIFLLIFVMPIFDMMNFTGV